MNVNNVDVKNRVFLITGGTSGVGKATALGLARLGAKVVIISRSRERGQNTLNQIAEVTGNDKGEFLVADLSLQSSIKEVSEEFKRKYNNLHVLANLAGAMYFERQVTGEAIEMTLAVNYLSHFLLTYQLLDILKASRPARILTVAGAPRLLRAGSLNFEDIQFEKHFSGLRAISQATVARAIFTFELAQRLEGTGVTTITFHPGLVKSQLFSSAQKLPWFLKVILPIIQVVAQDECDVAVYLAAAREVEKVSGVLFNDKMKVVPLHEKFDDNVRRKLWSVSEQLTDISAL